MRYVIASVLTLAILFLISSGESRMAASELSPQGVAKINLNPNDYWFGQPGYQWGIKQVQAPAAWDITTGSSSVVIADLDTGADPNHPDLSAKLISGYNFVAGNTDTTDDNGHGTSIAGIAAASTNNTIGIAGVSWGSPLMPVKVCDALGNCDDSAIVSGITYAADHGVKVINMPFGAPGSCPSAMQDAINYAWNVGVVLVASTGNDGGAIGYPADCGYVIAVGATDQTDTVASWSNFGSSLDLVAPGVSIWCTTLPYSMGYPLAYGACTGTSAAAPIVSGAAALLMSKGASNNATVNALTAGADDLGAAGWDQYYGWGRLNIHRSLLAIVCPNGIIPPWTVPAGDSDCDGFTTTVENFVGTDPNVACGFNAWPPDFNNDQRVNLSDELHFNPVFNSVAGDGVYQARYDLNADGRINLSDVLKLQSFFNLSCTP
jgi:subtilisin family serine protease